MLNAQWVGYRSTVWHLHQGLHQTGLYLGKSNNVTSLELPPPISILNFIPCDACDMSVIQQGFDGFNIFAIH